MVPTEIRQDSKQVWKLALIAFAASAAVFFYLGYLPTMLWIALIALGMVLIYNLISGQSKGAIIVLNDEGVFDRRLKVGVIRWGDIRRISSHDMDGALYISLELHNKGAYDARRPMWLKLASQANRGLGFSSIAISTNGLNIDHDELVHLLHHGCEEASQRNVEIA